MYTPTHLKPWTHPGNYVGATWEDWYPVLGRHRESDLLTNCNFDVALTRLRPLNTEIRLVVNGFPSGRTVIHDTVYVVHESHDLVGWVEWIGIHKSNEAALREADEIRESLDCYPILDESAWSEAEYNEVQDYWRREPLRFRVELCRDAGVSVFSARRDYVEDELYDYLREVVVVA